MSTFDHDGIRFHYEMTGIGPPVVFCHGLTGDSVVIQNLLGGSDGYSLVAWDCRGHGRTEPMGPPDAFCFERFAADLRALLTHLDIQHAVVGGVSMGAGVATRFALDYPDLVDRLVLVRPAWLDRPSPEPLQPLEIVAEYLERFGAEEGKKQFAKLPLLDAVRAVDPTAARSMVELFREPRAWERRVRLQRMPRSCPIRDWSEVAHLTMPALVLGCEPDYVHPFSYAQEWVRHLPNATFVEVPAKSQNEAGYSAAVRAALAWSLRTPPLTPSLLLEYGRPRIEAGRKNDQSQGQA